MCRKLLKRPVAWASLVLGLAGIGSDAAAQTTWETRHLVIDDAVIDGDDPFAIIDPVWWTADIYEDIETYEGTLSEFSKPQRLIFAVVWYRSEVNNGGHDQFFFNSTGIVWPDALEALRTVGLEPFAEILSQAVARFSQPPSRERTARQEQLDRDRPDFEDLDTRFYDLEISIDMDAAMMAFIKAQREAFYFDGTVKVPK